jgi:transposase
MIGPARERPTDLASETGIPLATLSRWRLDATDRPVEAMMTDTSTRSAAEKLRLVLEASALTDRELGEFLRREGVHEAELTAWRRRATEALGAKQSPAARSQSRQVRGLERELRRKEKALAELAALLVLQKKAQTLWEDVDDGIQ